MIQRSRADGLARGCYGLFVSVAHDYDFAGVVQPLLDVRAGKLLRCSRHDNCVGRTTVTGLIAAECVTPPVPRTTSRRHA